MFGRKKKSTDQIRNEVIRRLWPNGNVPKEIATMFEDDEVLMIEQISKIYAKELLKEFVSNTV